MACRITFSDEAGRWRDGLGDKDAHRLAAALECLSESGSSLRRPLVGTIRSSEIHKLKELRVPSGNIRVLFAFDGNQEAVMLVGGDKTGQWNRWYPKAIQRAERHYAEHQRAIGKEAACRTSRRAAGRGR